MLLTILSTTGDFGNGSMAGGFFNAGTPGGTLNTPGEKKVWRHFEYLLDILSCVFHLQGGAQRAHNIIPVNIKDILDEADEKLKIEDTEAHMVFFFTLNYLNYKTQLIVLLGYICRYCRTDFR